MKKKLYLPVSEYTSEDLTTVSGDTSIVEVYQLMKKNDIRHLPVLNEENKPIGMISDRDVRFCAHMTGASELTAFEIMTRNPFTIGHATPIGRVAFEMSQGKLGSALIVNDDGSLFGIFTTTDALNVLVEIFNDNFPMELQEWDPKNADAVNLF